MRINKYLAQLGYATRRGGDELVAKGLVLINGRKAVLGDKVAEGDTVEVLQNGPPKKYLYYVYNKPVGVITHSPKEGEVDIKKSLSKAPGLGDVYPVGRLDKESEGLMILTNDGRIVDRLLSPDSEHDKEYLVHTRETLRTSFKKNMEGGLDIDGYVTKKCKIDVLGEKYFKITLREGKKHQIRRMVAALHNIVISLKRTRVLNITLGRLSPGGYRALTAAERSEFLQQLGLIN